MSREANTSRLSHSKVDSDSEDDEEERYIKQTDQKMKLCFIDIVSQRCKGKKSIKKDTPTYKSIDTIAKEHPILGNLDLELAKCLLNN